MKRSPVKAYGGKRAELLSSVLSRNTSDGSNDVESDPAPRRGVPVQVIDEGTRRSWLDITTPGLAARYGWSDQYRALCVQSTQRRAPQRLLARAIDGYLEQVVSLETIAALRGMPAPEVERELRTAGIEPTPQMVV